MSRKTREIKRNFKVFCEGDTEYHYVDEMRHQLKLSIALKLVNMKGGGYSSFLNALRTDGNANCLAKFIIIDGDKAVNEIGEKKNLKKLIEYCILQNNSGRTPHILIVNTPDFEFLGCLHTPNYKGQSIEQYIIKEMGYQNINAFKTDKKIYHVLNTNGNSSDVMLAALRKENCLVVNQCTVNKSRFEIQVVTVSKWENLGHSGSNINEYFEILNCF